MNSLIKLGSAAVTMSSLELVEFINAERNASESELRHDHFMAKVPLVLGESVAPNFRGYYKASNGKRNPCYNLPKREACLMTMSYSYELQAKVFDKMTALEELQRVTSAAPIEQDLRVIALLADFLNVSPSGKITMARVALEHSAPHLLPALPAYAVDAPAGSTAGSSEPTASLTVLLKKFGVDGTAAQWNKLLHSAGMLEQLERKRSTGRMHKFWSVSKDGLQFGKNVTSPENPRETSPHWYEGKFLSLLDYVCMV